MKNPQTQQQRRYRSLWWVWLCWGISLLLMGRIDGVYRHVGEILLFVTVLWFLKLIFHLTKTEKVMFGKKRDVILSSEQKPILKPPPSVLTEETGDRRNPPLLEQPLPPSSPAKSCTVIAAQTILVGEMDICGDCQILGEVQGILRLTEGTLSVMKGGKVAGDIHVPSVVIDGFVTGNCYSSSVEIRENGELQGRCSSEQLVIMVGGVFWGVSERLEPIEQIQGSLKEEKRHEKRTLKDAQSVLSGDNVDLNPSLSCIEKSDTNKIKSSGTPEKLSY